MSEMLTDDGDLILPGDRVKVVGLGEHPEPPEWERPEVAHRGVVTSVDDDSFDFQIRSPNGREGATFTVDTERGVVERLLYRAGGDEDWLTQELVSVSVTDRS